MWASGSCLADGQPQDAKPFRQPSPRIRLLHPARRRSSSNRPPSTRHRSDATDRRSRKPDPTPVRTVPTIAEESQDLAGRARQRRLRADEMTGGTFTVSNLGMYGVEHFTAIINPPEAAILAVGAARREAVVLDDDSIAARTR
ncbi:2-oxo acid dehydrogenase subunit E2, partial [Kribbella sp. NPDC051936]|uniref:2-oxo acid dehydrogenase subunit E2 n=1 Tax=Kribbella sp. NPDC051936 TaxID=3154946 RepID=UPI003426C261